MVKKGEVVSGGGENPSRTQLQRNLLFSWLRCIFRLLSSSYISSLRSHFPFPTHTPHKGWNQGTTTKPAFLLIGEMWEGMWGGRGECQGSSDPLLLRKLSLDINIHQFILLFLGRNGQPRITNSMKESPKQISIAMNLQGYVWMYVYMKWRGTQCLINNPRS